MYNSISQANTERALSEALLYNIYIVTTPSREFGRYQCGWQVGDVDFGTLYVHCLHSISVIDAFILNCI